MPRSTEEILAQADELAREFEEYDPKPGDRERVSPEFRLRIAALKRAEAEAEVAAAVTEARRKQISWAKIGASLGTTGQSARERYSKLGAKKRATSGAVRKRGGKTTRRARRPNRTGEPNERTKAG